MSDVLRKILATKREEVVDRASRTPLRQLSEQAADLPPCRGFSQALEIRMHERSPAVIAEVKKASPSKGLIRADFDPESIAKAYAAGGAACLSVLTDAPYFQGHEDYLVAARNACNLPVLRKDFMVDAWQIYESRVLGADCVLLIVSALGDAVMLEMTILALELGMDVLVEVHDAEELERALQLPPACIIGINNRNLRTFETSLDMTLQLLDQVPENRLLVTESGILNRDDVNTMLEAGVFGFLIGESLMRQPDPGTALKKLIAHA